jgi:predicted dehydrogenase
MRFGLMGTGYWAAEVHAKALAGHPDATLVGVWGRDPAKAAAVAGRYGARPYPDLDALLDDVDAVAIALPPDVQAELAVQAARAGRHLLLDKPLALSTGAADAVVDAVRERDLASVIFFTDRYSPNVEEFLRDAAATPGWSGARAILFASIFQPGNPYGASPWRRDKGGLWDVGPHMLAVLLPVLGPVSYVYATLGPHQTAYVTLEHERGAVSTMALSLAVPPAMASQESVLYGTAGTRPVPEGELDGIAAHQAATSQLIAAAAAPPGGRGHPCDVRFGREVVAILTAAEASTRGRAPVKVDAC